MIDEQPEPYLELFKQKCMKCEIIYGAEVWLKNGGAVNVIEYYEEPPTDIPVILSHGYCGSCYPLAIQDMIEEAKRIDRPKVVAGLELLLERIKSEQGDDTHESNRH